MKCSFPVHCVGTVWIRTQLGSGFAALCSIKTHSTSAAHFMWECVSCHCRSSTVYQS